MPVLDGLLCLTTLVTAASLYWIEEISDDDDDENDDGNGQNFIPDTTTTTTTTTTMSSSSTSSSSSRMTMSNNSNRTIIATTRRRRRRNNNTVRRYQMDVSVALAAWQRLQTVLCTCIDFLADTNIPPVTVYRISSIALSTTMFYTQLCKVLEEKIGIPSQYVVDLLSISDNVFYMIPLSTVVCALCSAIIVWTKCNPSHIVILCGLVTLFFVECLFPVTVTVSMALCLFEIISTVDAIILSLSMFAVGSVNSRCIRAVIYPSLGLG